MLDLIKLDLEWFGDGAGDGAGAPAEGSSEGGQAAETASFPTAPTRRSKNDAYANVRFGKQATSGTDADAGAPVGTETEETAEAQESPEDRQKAYNDLVKGKYKDLYTQDTQRIINQRFKETKQQEELIRKQNEVLDIMKQRYNTQDLDDLKTALDNDDSMWEAAADEAGMTVRQYKEFQRVQRENMANSRMLHEFEMQRKANEIMGRWNAEAAALREKFPQFDLAAESQNPQFINMLRHGVPVEVAYKALHLDDIVTEAMKTTAVAAEKRVVDNVRAKGSRPVENGLSSQATFTVKNDVTKLNKADRAEIARRVQQGEQISF